MSASPLVAHALLCWAGVLAGLVPLAAQAQAVRDSAGIRIVENTTPALSPTRAWRLSPQPILDIGVTGDAPEYEFQNIMGVVRLANGNYVVADMGSSQLRWFDSTGRFVRSLGRSGQGPGEFRQLMGVKRLAGDTLLGDNSRQGMEVFTSDGRYAGRIKPAAGSTTGVPLLPTIIASFDNGMFIASPWSSGLRRAPRGAVHVESTTYVVLRRDGSAAGSIGPVPSLTAGTANTRTMPVQFGAAQVAGSDGRLFHHGFGDKYEIRSYDHTGRLQRIMRRTWTPRRLTDSELAAWKEHYATPARGEPGGEPVSSLRQIRLANLDQLIISPTLPAFSQMHVDRTGALWVREPKATHYYTMGSFSAVPSEAARYSVFDSEGRWLCEVALPEGVKVLEIGDTYLAGVRKDALDVEHVVVYRITKGG